MQQSIWSPFQARSSGEAKRLALLKVRTFMEISSLGWVLTRLVEKMFCTRSACVREKLSIESGCGSLSGLIEVNEGGC